MKSKKTYYILPDEVIGRTLPAAVSYIESSPSVYCDVPDGAFIEIFVDVFLDDGVFTFSKKIVIDDWEKTPSGLPKWKRILGIDKSADDCDVITGIDNYVSLDDNRYELEVIPSRKKNGEVTFDIASSRIVAI